MEKINELLNNVKERFTNPLIFSFLCSWIVINWQITIALLWYDNAQIQKEGYASIFSFIRSHLNFADTIGSPLLFAISYTIVIPFLKLLIRALYVWISKRGDAWIFKFSKEGKVSIAKYLKLKSDYEQRTLELEKVITDEGEYYQKYNSLSDELMELRQTNLKTLGELTETKTTLSAIYDTRILNGTWLNTHTYEDGKKDSEMALIENGKYYIISDAGENLHMFDIVNFSYDRDRETVFFIKEITLKEEGKRHKSFHLNINRLKFQGKDLLVGTENKTTMITYSRR